MSQHFSALPIKAAIVLKTTSLLRLRGIISRVLSLTGVLLSCILLLIHLIRRLFNLVVFTHGIDVFRLDLGHFNFLIVFVVPLIIILNYLAKKFFDC
jgi:hypothetical protein